MVENSRATTVGQAAAQDASRPQTIGRQARSDKDPDCFAVGKFLGNAPTKKDSGSGMTCWHRAHAWRKAEVSRKLHRVLLDKLRDANELNFPTSLPSVRRYVLRVAEKSKLSRSR